MAATRATRFNYVAIDPNGQRVKGVIQGSSEVTVRTALLDDGWTPISIKKAAGGGGLSMNVSMRKFHLDTYELAEFARQLHQLLRAGLPVPQALETMAQQSEPQLAEVCLDVAHQVISGVPLAGAFRAHPNVFDDVFCSYVTAGEQGGTLVETTGRLTRMLEKQASLARKVNSVTIYPKIVSGVISVLVSGLIIFIVPRFAVIYKSFHSQLPAPTQKLIDLSRIMTPIRVWHPLFAQPLPIIHGVPVPNFASPLFVLAVTVVAFLYWVRRTRDNLKVGERLDRIRFRIPLVGALSKRMSLYRWSSTLAGALQSGLQPYTALDLSARASGSRWHRHVAPQIQEAVQTGRSIGSAMRNLGDLYPINVRSMVETGERTGDVTAMLDSVTTALEDDIDTQVSGLGAKLEVALLAFMGATVGSVLVVLYLPILNLSQAAAHAAG